MDELVQRVFDDPLRPELLERGQDLPHDRLTDDGFDRHPTIL